MLIVLPRVSGGPTGANTLVGGNVSVEPQPPRVERPRPELLAELVERRRRVAAEQVLHHPHLAVVHERHVDVRPRDEVHRHPPARRAAHGDADAVAVGRRREQLERRRVDRPRPLLRPAEEAPRPLPRLDPRRRQIAELVADRLDPRRHQVDERRPVLHAERRPVELLVRDEAGMVVPAPARELDTVDGGMMRPGQLVETAEPGQADSRLAVHGARERIRGRQRVVHALSLPHAADGGNTSAPGAERDQYVISACRSSPSSFSRPPRNVSSMMKHAPTTTAPSCSTSPRIASTVPPVASTSSWITTRAPSGISSGCNSSAFSPYSST